MQDYLSLIYVSTIGMNLMCGLFIIFSKLRQYGVQFNAVIACCILTSVYQFSTWQYHMSSDLSSSLFWLKAQSIIVLLTIIPVGLVYALWCDIKKTKHIFLLMSIPISILIIVNIISPYGMRYTAEIAPSVNEFSLMGEQLVYRLTGVSSPWMLAYQVLCLFALSVLIRWLLIHRSKLPPYAWNILLAILVLQVGATLLSGLSDKGAINLIYLGGLPFTLINLLCCFRFSSLLRQESEALEKLVYEREALEKILVTLSNTASAKNAVDFFKSVISALQNASGATTGIILVYDGHPKKKVVKTTIAVHHQKIIENFSFDIKLIPEEFRDPNNQHIITHGLFEQYPKVEFYTNIKARAMISVPMFNPYNEAIGVMSLYFKKDSQPDASFINVVKVCATRLAAEYTRELLVNELEKSAYYDYLTKLPNITRLNKFIGEAGEHLGKNNNSSIIIKIDLDGFSELNRRIGFDNSEKVLSVIGDRFLAYANDEVFIARTGGDEFTFVLLQASGDFDALIDLHWKALQSMLNTGIKLDSETIHLQCSGGSIIYPQDVPKDISVLRCVEFALREAKASGKNRLQPFNNQMVASINRRKRLEIDLKNALNTPGDDSLFVVFQPKVNEDGKLLGAEALSRWEHKHLGAISPVEFIELAESCGLINELGLWCAESVCSTLSTWKKEGFEPSGRIGINVSAQQFDEPQFVDKLMAILERFDIPPKKIDLELTESSLIKNIEQSIVTMKALRELDFSISLDDFGTGYSSLSYLKDLPLDYLKIDRSFVVDAERENSLHLLEAILSLGKNMKLRTVAEGIETVEQLSLLIDLECDIYQGYYFSRPLRPNNFWSWAINHEN